MRQLLFIEKEKMGKKLCIVLAVMAILLMGISGYQLYKIQTEYQEGTDLYDELAAQMVKMQQKDTPKQTEAETTDKVSNTGEAPTTSADDTAAKTDEIPKSTDDCPVTIDFEGLTAYNDDIVGWIYMEDTLINYPVVQSDDNSYYLRRMLNGKYNIAGTIFMDYRNNADMSDLNTIIYGHNVKNGSMFGDIPKYKEQSFYDAHPVMWFITPDGTYRIDIIAGMITDTSSDAYDIFDNDESLDTFLEDIIKNSTFKSNVDINGIEKIVTLSTCTYEFDDARYILIGSIVPVS